MSAEEQQEHAALYALGLLTADEAAALEEAMTADPELAALVRGLREAAHQTVLGLPQIAPAAALKARVLDLVAAEAAGARPAPAPVAGKIVPFRPLAWLPWAIAAALAVFCGLLGSQRADLRRELAALQAVDPLSQVAVYTLDATGNASAGAASVAWAPSRQSGMLNLSGATALKSGKDYQLWAVDPASKDPISAGVVKIDAKGHAKLVFKPEAAVSHAAAFAISVEPAGGSPKKTGPIVFVGAE